MESVWRRCRYVQSVAMLHAGSKVDSIDFWAQRVRQIETAIHREQHRILGGVPLTILTHIRLGTKTSAREKGLTSLQLLQLLGQQCCMQMHGSSNGQF